MAEHLIAIFNEEKAPVIAQVVTWIAVAILVPIALINRYYFAAIIVVVFAVAGFRDFRQRTAVGQPPPEPRPAPPAAPTPPETPPVFPI